MAGYTGPRRGGKKFTSAKLTGLFKTKTRGLAVGGVEGEYLDALIEKIKDAKKKDRGLTFFLWRNEPDEDKPKQAPFSLSVDVALEKGERPGKRKAIEPDPFDEPEPESEPEADDPFADD